MPHMPGKEDFRILVYNKGLENNIFMLSIFPLKSKKTAILQKQVIDLWHEKEKEICSWPETIQACVSSSDPPDRWIFDLTLINTFQWHEEDKARKVGVTDQFLGGIKKSIDASNQRRVNKIEDLDSWIVRNLQTAGIQPDEEVAMNSETPGSIIDRLSILRLRIYHMRQETLREDAAKKHIEKCQNKLEVLFEQERDMDRCLDELFSDLTEARKRLKVYFQHKMYNDPDTNPEIYRNK